MTKDKDEYKRKEFEERMTELYEKKHTNPWKLLTRSDGRDYLDLYIQLRWEGWKEAVKTLKHARMA